MANVLAAAHAATLVVAAAIVVAFAWLPPLLGFPLAVAVACLWCMWLESPDWHSSESDVTIEETDTNTMPVFRSRRPLPYLNDGMGFLVAAVAVVAATSLHVLALRVTDPTIVALSFLLIVVVVAAVSSWRVAVATSLGAFLSFNFFFLPPTGTLVIAEARHLVALFTLLAVSLVASYLAAEVRFRADEAAKADVARHSAELKSSLLASFGHDLKTPLTAVTVAVNNLQALWLTEEQRREQAAIVQTELTRLNRLFQNLIDIARIESHAVAAEPEWVAPAEILEAALQQVAPSLAQHRVEVDAGDDGLIVRLDPRLTSAALAHLLENAAQHSPQGSAIQLGATMVGGEVRFAVRDSGTGLPAEPLRDASRTSGTRRGGNGTGLGLSISRGLLSAEGGRIAGENDRRGGAIFTIAVPVEWRTLSDSASGAEV